MTTQNDPSTASARAALYQKTAKVGRYLNRTFAFLNGSPVGNSFTGNLALGVTSGGVGAALINGVAPPFVTKVDCNEPTITGVQLTNLDENLLVTLTYNDPMEDDIYVLYSNLGKSFGPSSVTQIGPDQVQLLFPSVLVLPPGFYSLKVLRASDPTECFSTRNGLFTVAGAPSCTISVTGWSGPGIFPNPPLSPGTNDVTVSVTGSGFTSGTLFVTIFPVFGGPSNLPIDSISVIDDNNIDVQFDTLPFETGNYAVRVGITEVVDCEDEYGDVFGEDMLAVDFS